MTPYDFQPHAVPQEREIQRLPFFFKFMPIPRRHGDAHEKNQEFRNWGHSAKGVQPGADCYPADDGGLYRGDYLSSGAYQQSGKRHKRTAEAVHRPHLPGNHGCCGFPEHGPEHAAGGLHCQRHVRGSGRNCSNAG